MLLGKPDSFVTCSCEIDLLLMIERIYLRLYLDSILALNFGSKCYEFLLDLLKYYLDLVTLMFYNSVLLMALLKQKSAILRQFKLWQI